MRDLTPSEVGSLLFKVRDDLELIAAETKIIGTLTDIEDLIQLLAKAPRSVR